MRAVRTGADRGLSREQFLFAYEPNYRIGDRLYAYALGQYERDRFQGFSSRISASGGLGYRVSDTIKLTQDASVFLQADNNSFVSTTGVEAALGGNLSARLAYVVEHDTDPPAGAVKTDTLTRFTLVYGF